MYKQSEKSSVKEGQQTVKQTKKIVIPPKVQDHLIPNLHADLFNPYYICNIDSEYLRSAHHKEQPKEGIHINFKTMMESNDDFGDLPSRKSSISSLEDMTIRTGNNNNEKQFLKIIQRENAIEPNEKKKSEQESVKVQAIQMSSSIKQKELQGEGDMKNKIITGCNCKKSKCLKSYCQCFTNKKKCTELCKCFSCENIDLTIPLKKRQESDLNCNCKKTKCTKKYCECFSHGIACGSGCRCNDCQNS